MPVNNHNWEKIIKLHQYLKSLIIRGEEFGGNFDAFLQPSLEQRSALDHLIRARAAELGLSEHENNVDYIEQQYDKVVGHLYRAFLMRPIG
ncbi:MAG: hypothetical protein AB1656_12125 [Candidatus Omnitrophota bacterium]